MHLGILNDQKHRERVILSGAVPCDRCDGTGNELYSMYHQCSDCGGSGKARRLGPPDPRVPWSPGLHQPGCQALLSPQWPCDCEAAALDWREPAPGPLHDVWGAAALDAAQPRREGD